MKARNEDNERVMPLNDNARFLLLALGVFCLMLGITVLLFALIEQLFFELNFGQPLALIALIALALGGLLLRYGRQRMK